MKRLIFGGLSALVMAAGFASVVEAKPVTSNPRIAVSPSHSTDSTWTRTQPFNLVHLAYQGFFENEGIPMGGRFLNDYREGQITAADLVQVGIKTNRLPAETQDDREYIHAVELQLDGLLGS